MFGFYEEGGSAAEKNSRGPEQTVSEIIDKLYPEALKCGISCFDFWNMSLKEIADVMEAYFQNEEKRIREKAKFDYTLAKLISYSCNAPDKFPNIEKVYPIFEDTKQNKNTQDWKLIKAQMNEVARYNNRKKAEVNDIDGR